MLFVQNQYQYLVLEKMPEPVLVSQFANQEYLMHLQHSVTNKNCLVIASLTAPIEQALQLLMLLHTLHICGAASITLFSPYLGYQRQDKILPQELHGLRWADAMLHAAKVDKIITIEPHCLQSLQQLQVPVFVYNAQPIFIEDMERLVHLGFGFVFPDAGALERYSWITQHFPDVVQGSFTKQRLGNGLIELSSFSGKVGNKVILYDDILDSGQTLLQICIVLKQMGVQEIVIFVTHAFFHGKAFYDMFNCGVQMIYCTNSLPAAAQIQHPKIKVKSINFFLQNRL